MTRLSAALIFLAATALHADQEAGNVAHVQASQYDRCYAKSVPSERYGNAGTTTVVRVTDQADAVVHQFDWYAPQLRLACNISDSKTPVGVSIVQFGPWHRGREASNEHLAIAFHFKGEKVAEFSTLDLAGTPDNVSASVSHYTVIQKIEGYEFQGGNQAVFRIQTEDGRTLTFDPTTGDRIQ